MKFLKFVSSFEAEKTLLTLSKSLQKELVQLARESARVVFRHISSPENIPGFPRSVKGGYIRVPADLDGCEVGDVVEAHPWR
jgi:molybdopterin biosynthesis enzyme